MFYFSFLSVLFPCYFNCSDSFRGSDAPGSTQRFRIHRATIQLPGWCRPRVRR